ncbi:mTERF domain-containing protein, partial [Cephalotus follicularis]
FLENPSMLSIRNVSSNANQHSFTESYLINSFGFSPQSALSASKYVHLETPEKPDSVVKFFESHGFSKSRMSLLARRCPSILSCRDPAKLFLPKIEFLYSVGLSSVDVVNSISAFPILLHRSLRDRIIPSYDYLKGLFPSEDKLAISIKRFPDVLAYDPQTYIEPNIAILQQYGVPKANIMALLSQHPRAFFMKPDQFKEVVEELKKMGINPSAYRFVYAINSKRSLSKLTWQKKLDVYRRCGWSDKEILLAFTKNPLCIMFSEDKILAAMDTFVNKLGWDSSLVARCPNIIGMSLKKRIAPRSAVIQVLLSKGLIDRSVAISTMFICTEKLFLQKYVARYEEKVPHLLKVYQENMDLSK